MDKQLEEICSVPNIGELIGKNYNISDIILDRFYRLTSQPKDFKEVPKAFGGKLHRFNFPFVRVKGAYTLRTNWEMLEWLMQNAKDKSGYFKHFRNTKIIDEALKDYAKGFQYGFDHFIQDVATTPYSIANNENEKAARIFDFLSPIMSLGFSVTYENEKPKFEWYEIGVLNGQLYCAWYLILSNYRLFESFFSPEECHNDSCKPPKNFKNNFDDVKTETLFNHFSGLRKYISDQHITDFLWAAFDKKVIPKEKYSLTNVQSKQKIYRLFYSYYELAGKPHGKQENYASLLSNYFKGYNLKTIMSNFSK